MTPADIIVEQQRIRTALKLADERLLALDVLAEWIAEMDDETNYVPKEPRG